MRRLAIVLLALTACGAPAERVITTASMPPEDPNSFVVTIPTTTTVPTTRAGSPRASRHRPPARVSGSPTSPASGVVQDGDFWRRLANCECASGHCSGPYIGFFQFSRDTAAKVGIDGSESYEEQRAAAIRWLEMIGGRGGSRSGWPVCWWKAGGQ